MPSTQFSTLSIASGIDAFNTAIHSLIHSYVCDDAAPESEQNGYLNELSSEEQAKVLKRQCDQKQVVLYSGKGAHPACIRATSAALFRHLEIPIIQGDVAYFQRDSWIQKTKLVAIPGGMSTTDIVIALGRIGLSTIKKAVSENHVSYLGLCAGAYLASRTRQFNGIVLAAPFQSDAPTLFQGIAVGPVAERAPPHKHVRTVTLYQGNEQIEGPLYYNHGCAFEGQQHTTTVLARYFNSQAAIIHVKNAAINAVLSGVHPEFPEPGASPEPEDPYLSPSFSETTFKVMLQALGLIIPK